MNEKKEQENFDSATKIIDRFLLIIIIILSRIELYNDLQRRNYIMSNLRFWIIDLELFGSNYNSENVLFYSKRDSYTITCTTSHEKKSYNQKFWF